MTPFVRWLISNSPLPHVRFSGTLLVWLGLMACLSSPAHAQGNATLAEALFDEGRNLFEARDYDKACAKFKESQRLDPATGTLLNLAMCYEKAGRLATAWSTWREAASSARAANQPDREEHARDMAKKLEGKLARMTIMVKGDTNIPQGFWVTQDGTPQPPAAWGVSLPIDAGAHHFEAGAPGFLTWTSDVQIKDGQNVTVTVPILALQGTPVAAPPPQEEVVPLEEQPAEEAPEEEVAEEQASEPEQASSGSKKGLKIAGITLTAAGALGLTVGSVFGIRALTLNNKSKDQCLEDEPNVCSFEGKDLRDQALTSANVSNVLIGVGAAALTTGIVLLVVAKKKSAEVALSPSPFGGQLSVSGAF